MDTNDIINISYYIDEYNSNGDYKVSSINLYDKAGNSLTIYNSILHPSETNKMDFSAADFTVTGAEEDKNPPKIEYVTVDKKNAVPGDTVTITLKATDDVLGVKSCQLYLKLPDGNEKTIFFSKVSDEIFEVKYGAGEYGLSGIYIIKSIAITDKADNYIRYYNSNIYPDNKNKLDLSAADFNVSDAITDLEAPRLVSVSVDKKEVRPGDTVKVTIEVSDDASGVEYLNAGIIGYKDFYESGLYEKELNIDWKQVSENVYEGHYTVGQYNNENGTYAITYVSIKDRSGRSASYGNYIFYPKHSNKFDFSAADFNVVGATPDFQAPRIESVAVDKKEIVPGDTVTITVKVTDNVSGVDHCSILLAYPNANYKTLNLEKVSDGVYEGKFTSSSNLKDGTYSIYFIQVGDNAGNDVTYYNLILHPNRDNKMDFCDADFIMDSEPPKIESVSVDKKLVGVGDTVKITVKVSDESGADYFAAKVVETKSYISRDIATKELQINWQKVSEGVYEGIYTVKEDDLDGKYKIQNIYLKDKVGNYIYYYNQDFYTSNYNLFDFTSTDFTIKFTAADLISVSIDKKHLSFSEAATLTIQAVDDVKGIDSIRATYRVRKSVPDKDKYKQVYLSYVGNNTYQAYVGTNMYEPDDTYELEEVQIVDKAGYSITYYGYKNIFGEYRDLSDAYFTVSVSYYDDVSPLFNGITVDKKSGTIGETLTFNIDCNNYKSAIRNSEPSKFNEGSYISLVSETGKVVSCPIIYENGRYYSIFNIGKYTEEGSWMVYLVYLEDIAGNRVKLGNTKAVYNSLDTYDKLVNFSEAEFSVYGTNSDKNGPVLEKITVNKTNINYNQINTITLKAKDDLSRIKVSVNSNINYEASSMIFISPEGEAKIYPVKEGKDSYYVDFYLDEYNKAGLWKMAAVILIDNAGNASYYVQSNLSDKDYMQVEAYFIMNGTTTKMDLSPYNINVLNPKEDSQAPVLNKAVIDKTRVNGKDEVNITFDIQDNRFINNGFSIGYIVYNNDNEYKTADIIKQNGKFTAKVNFDGFGKNGLWKVDHIRLEDGAGNAIVYINSTQKTNQEGSKSMDLSYLNITATDMQPITEESIIINKVAVSSNTINIFGNTQLEIAIDATGDLSKINYSIYETTIVYFTSSGKYRKIAPLQYQNGKLTAKLDFNGNDGFGIWRLEEIRIGLKDDSSLIVIDPANPYKKLFNRGKIKIMLMDFSECDITVTGPTKDSSKPILKTVELSTSTVDINGNVIININAEDESGIHSVKATYLTPAGQDVQYILTKASEGFQANISPYSLGASVGQWQLKTVEIIDNSGNVNIIGNYKNNGLDLKTVDKLMDLSAGDFNVTDRILADVTGDNQVDILDLALAARSYNLDQNSPYWEARADVNKDKKVDIYDLVLICRRQ